MIIYTYDPLGRLTEATYASGERYAYRYDAVGNRKRMTETTALDATSVTTYTYDAANRLTSAGGVTYTWDDRGNLTHDGTFTYTYNAAGRLVRAESVTATRVYTYNAAGLRVAQAVNGAETTFAWDWATGVPELLDDGSRTYLVGHETLGWDEGASWRYVLPDALGSVRQAADGTGAVTAARAWTPYGVELGGAQAGLGYAGEWWDAGLEMQYLRARWYDVGVGRFTREDPWEGLAQLPGTLVGYTYVLANPLRHIDPSGHRSEYIDYAYFSRPGVINHVEFLNPWPHILPLDQAHGSWLRTLRHSSSLVRETIDDAQNLIISYPADNNRMRMSDFYRTVREIAREHIEEDACYVFNKDLAVSYLTLVTLSYFPTVGTTIDVPGGGVDRVWNHYPLYLYGARPIIEPGWDKAGHFFNMALYTFVQRYADTFELDEGGQIRTAAEMNLRATWARERFVARVVGSPYSDPFSAIDEAFGQHAGAYIPSNHMRGASEEELHAYAWATILGSAYEYWSGDRWGNRTAHEKLANRDPRINEGLTDQGVLRDLLANRLGAEFGIQVFRSPGLPIPYIHYDGVSIPLGVIDE